MLNKYKSNDYEKCIRNAIYESLTLQILFLILAGMNLCVPSQNIFLIALKISFFSYWSIVLIMLICRGNSLTKDDFQYLRFGIIFNAILFFGLMFIVGFILYGWQ